MLSLQYLNKVNMLKINLSPPKNIDTERLDAAPIGMLLDNSKGGILIFKL